MIASLIISKDSNQIKQEIKNRLFILGISSPHPDLLYFDSSTKLGIEQARIIKRYLSLKPHSLKGKIVILENASKLTDEAQNSLLKTLEELPLNCLFILGANSDVNFLPTILSRCQITKLDKSQAEKADVQAGTPEVDIEKIIQMDIPERFEYIEKLKDRKQFLIDLIVYFRGEMIKNADNKKVNEYVKTLMQAEEWANANVNIRAILEYLMLVMPPRR